MNINIILSIITFFITLLLSVVVLLESYKNQINKIFFGFGFATSMWIASNFLADLSRTNFWALFFSRMAIIWTALLPLLFNILITRLYLLQNTAYQKAYSIIYKLSLLSTTIILLLSPTKFNIIEVTINSWGTGYSPGILYYLLFVYLLFSFSFSFLYLFNIYTKSSDPMRSQVRLMLIGSLTAAIVSVVTNIIGPVLGNSFVSLFGPPAIIFFVGFTAIAVLKHRLFNIKVIATELVIFLLWIFILIRALIAPDLNGLLIECGLLLVTIVVGILLIKSVIREVKQREKIEKLATELQKANNRLTELDRQKSEFVSFATHQLRAPLTAMKGYASLILEGDLGKLSREIRSAITRIYDSSNTLTNIVDDYLNISRIELGTMRYAFDLVDLKDLIENVVGELKPNIEKSKLKFIVEVDPLQKYIVHADKDKFKQIIANLIDNSIKYTPAGAVHVALTRKEGKIIFSVRDNGIGISQEVMPKLFVKFTRADNGTRQNIHGTGLGLFVAKEIVTAHKGRIWAESAGEGKGSAFFVELEEVI